MKTKLQKAAIQIKSKIRNGLHTAGKTVFRPVLRKIVQQEDMIRLVAANHFKIRAMLKNTQGLPINVLFVCHEPALWSMFESVYQAMAEDPGFSPKIIALPYAHGTLPAGEYKDAGMAEFLEEHGISVIRGYDKESQKWIKPDELSPDYIFFQTPYSFFPPEWHIEQVSLIARVCYIPYATCLFTGEVDEILHPLSFFRYARLIFKEGLVLRDMLVRKFKQNEWFNERSIVVSGHPKLDYAQKTPVLMGSAWKRGVSENVKRILWTPRWNTSEGNCHFFDYKDFFENFCENHSEIDFAFRPHPLCLQNFLKTGEMSTEQLATMEYAYEHSPNRVIDKSGDYHDTFLTSDILVSDVSSMMLEYFVMGKPVVYTHRVDQFNEFGVSLSKGFYWVRNESELKNTLEMLLSGNDPLRAVREELIKTELFVAGGGAGSQIARRIQSDFTS